MVLKIDNRIIKANAGESLLDLCKKLKLTTGKLSTEPLVAKVAGRIFTLNFVPVKSESISTEGLSTRKAIAASNGIVTLMRYKDSEGSDAYVRTAQFVIFLAINELWPNAVAKMSCSVGSGLYFKVSGAENFSVDILRDKIKQIIEQDITLERKRLSTEEAINYFASKGQTDKVELLKYRKYDFLDVYTYGNFADYYYGELMPSTSYLKVWKIAPAPNGFTFVFPSKKHPNKPAKLPNLPKLLKVYTLGKKWCELMDCEGIADLNEMVASGKIRELIRVNEALHEKEFSTVADRICRRKCKAVLLSGPSSSGKTTSANRLATQLRVHGKKPILMSLDDYYLDRDKILPGPDGTVDLEHINTIDTELFKQHFAALLRGEQVELPTFDFKLQKRVWLGHKLQLDSSSVIIIEGLHALNPTLLPDDMNRSLVFKLYVSPLLPLNLDNHNRISASSLRLLRRIVRDFEGRNSPVQKTISMWKSVRRGEERWIFPYQETADYIFNSSTLYELAVLKKHIFPLLTAVGPEEECYNEVRAIVKFLDFIQEADVDDEIPPTSLVREFIGGNSFYK
ncbi:MAG: nucleoside kinase [Clostridia bacterium]|nr:nucleoside kinase [Clostridia bacterium]